MPTPTLRDILRPSLTGAVRWPGGSAPPHTDAVISTFKSACHTAARRLHARATSHAPPTTGRNYHTLTLTLPDRTRIELLLHATLPFVAARNPSDPLSLDTTTYIPPPLDQADLTPDFLILHPDLLHARFTPEPWMQPLVEPATWEDMHYHKPARIADLVYNWFD